ncbi:MAG: phosphate acetyltransferase [Bacteriovoracaceae bacterium]|nr:phosphate acetyltransferase [Bacteriovoracaceae bacterium]
MSKSIYVGSAEALAGKSLVTLGLIEMMNGFNKRTALFRPVISDNDKNKQNVSTIQSHFGSDWVYEESYAYTKSEADMLMAKGQESELLEVVVNKYMALYDKYDFIVCEGTGYHGLNTSFELDLNIKLAKNLGTPVLFVASGKGKEDDQANISATLGFNAFKNANIPMIGAVLNMADEKQTLSIEAPYVALITENSGVSTLDSIDITHFKNSINTHSLHSSIEQAPSGGMTYKMFEYNMLKKVQEVKKHIVLPEGEDDRVLEATANLLQRGIVDVTVLGNIEQMNKRSAELKLDISKANLMDPANSPKLDEYAAELLELRKHKGMTEEKAKKAMKDVSFYGTMMVKKGDADGMVSGAAHSTGDTIRPAFQILKTQVGIPVVSSVFFMCLDGRVSLFGDCAVNPNPNAEQLAAIAISSAETAKAFGIPTKVAFHSYSTGTSGAGPDVELVTEATKIAREQNSEFDFEGPIQYDASINEEIAKKKMPESKVAGHARIHIFPDLNTGNTCYKAVQRESGAEAIGPMLQGLNGAVNDLSRGCSVLDIINTVFITAIQSRQFEK